MKKIFLIFIGFLLISLVSAVDINDSMHVQVQVTDDSGNLVVGTYNFNFSLSTSPSCTTSIFSKYFSSVQTDSRAISDFYLYDIPTNFTEQSYLGYYRDGILKNCSFISRNPYSFSADIWETKEKNLTDVSDIFMSWLTDNSGYYMNHTSAVNTLWGKWFYNMTSYGNYNYNQTSLISNTSLNNTYVSYNNAQVDINLGTKTLIAKNLNATNNVYFDNDVFAGYADTTGGFRGQYFKITSNFSEIGRQVYEVVVNGQRDIFATSRSLLETPSVFTRNQYHELSYEGTNNLTQNLAVFNSFYYHDTNFNSTNSQRAGNWGVRNNQKGTLSEVYGIEFEVTNFVNAQTGIINKGYGLKTLFDAEDGTFRNIYGLYIPQALKDTGTFNNFSGIWIDDQTQAQRNYGIVISSDNVGLTLGSDQDANITFDGTNLKFSYPNSSIAYFTGGINYNGTLVTHSPIFDKTQGNALDFIKDADELTTGGKPDDSKYYGYMEYEVPDETNCSFIVDEITYCWRTDNIPTNEKECSKDIKSIPKGYKIEEDKTYKKVCQTRIEKGVDLEDQLGLYQQAIYDLKKENELLKTEICKLNPLAIFCK